MNIDSDNISNDFPIKDKIYLNSASVSLTPKSSIKAMNDFLVSYSEIGPDSIEAGLFVKEKFFGARKKVSKLINCRSEEIIFTQSTTDGINIVANGLALKSESNIIIRGMGHEHHANYYPWLNLSKKIHTKNLTVDESGFFNFDELKSFLDKDTKLVSLSHALYNTGTILPIEQVGEILEKENIPYFLDTAQTVGCIGEFNFQNTKCNFMSFNGSKWLCGPMGIGVFYCKKDSSHFLEPIEIGGESAIIYENSKLAFKEIPDKFQTGFRNYIGIVGLEASVSYLLEFGLKNIRKKIMKLANLLRDELEKIPETTVYGPDNEEKRTSIVSFSIKKMEPQTVVQKLEKQNIVIAEREILAKKILRVSPHFFNNESEILQVIDFIKKL